MAFQRNNLFVVFTNKTTLNTQATKSSPAFIYSSTRHDDANNNATSRKRWPKHAPIYREERNLLNNDICPTRVIGEKKVRAAVNDIHVAANEVYEEIVISFLLHNDSVHELIRVRDFCE